MTANRWRKDRVVLVLIISTLIISGCGGSIDPGKDEPATTTPTMVSTATRTTTTAAPATSPLPEPTVLPSPSPTTRPAAGTPAATAFATPATQGQIPTLGYRVINTFPHDPTAFTQGLELEDGVLYEGTGLNGESSLRRVELETGEVLQQHDMDDEFFGEGITILNDHIYQLTWQSGTGFIYDRQTFEPLGEFIYAGEGWGLTDDDTLLIMSDGSSTLSFRVPETFDEVRRVEVRDDRGPVTRLNELEYIDGEIYANVWRTDIVVRIDPLSGSITARIDLSGLLSNEDRQQYRPDVLNGIAHDPASGRLLVTGKRWPKLFEIELVSEG